ncbi:Haloacid dehalogenase-like hydrolase (HAD) superfamily protein [Zea mays]|uniref:Mitochondrial import inner membrane translocase subunit TIM50 n=1 Tax=Zea mays TaxID=4577 RepID=A0A1D6FS56_MAIZE|nr:Haloacid dehalogenase-like hydrolase (HAD) superfamily protein [Zea mays]
MATAALCVTDAGDFIGSWIVKILLARGYAVRAPPATQIARGGRGQDMEDLSGQREVDLGGRRLRVACVGGGAREADPSMRSGARVVLDLDETLVCAYESSSLPSTMRTHAVEAGLHRFDMECVLSEKASKLQCFAFALSIAVFIYVNHKSGFTDASVNPHILCWEYREHVKDLSCLSKDFQRIVLVDNNPYSFLLQPLNGIPCVTFSAGQPVDDQVKTGYLMGTMFPLLKHLALQKDVRPALYEAFHMPEWFQRQGIPQIEQAV